MSNFLTMTPVLGGRRSETRPLQRRLCCLLRKTPISKGSEPERPNPIIHNLK